ncbi:MAG: hypothetical protein M3552_05120 [Planctomycetota bacterium]|nr:hypothetical protein [Planctomycetaceae bacterium]MDQ3330020.1 hypothetical protein [Planctomycetota bacterium]
MAKFVASTWNRKTRGQQKIKGFIQRGEHLKSALKSTQAKIDQQKFNSEGLVRGIFVAPEYFFSAKYAGMTVGNRKMPRPIGADSHAQLLKMLANISRMFPRILILPGTVAWKKPMNLREFGQRLAYHLGREQFRQPLNGDQLLRGLRAEWQWGVGGKIVNGEDRQDYEEANGVEMPTTLITDQEFADIATSHPGFYTHMVATVENDGGLGSAAHAALKRHNSSAVRHMMQNTAYAFLNGNVVFEYAKQGNYHEEAGDGSLVFAPGAKSGVQNIEGIRFGFEICLDHNLGTLSKQLRNGREIDIHIVMSDWVGFSAGNVVARDGGFFVHASTEPSVAGAWRISNGQKVLAHSLGSETIQGTPLSHWEIDVEVEDPFALAGTFMDPSRPVRKWASVTANRGGFRSHG